MAAEKPLRAGRGVALLLAALLIAASLIRIDAGPYAHLWSELSNAAHFPVFAVLTWLFFLILPGSSTSRRLGWSVFITVGVAVLVEIGQPFVSRSGNLRDVLIGGLGVAAAAWDCTRREIGASRPIRLIHLVLIAAIMAGLLQPAWEETRGMVWRSRNFPLLGDFERSSETRLWRVQKRPSVATTDARFVEQHATSGRKSLRLDCGPGSYAGIRYSAGASDGAATTGWPGRCSIRDRRSSCGCA